MSKFLKIFKKWWSQSLNGLLALIFAGEAKAQVTIPNPLYGILPPTPGEISVGLLPWFLIFVAAPIAGLIWYRKRGGKKKWPTVVVWIIVSLFVLAIGALVFLVFSQL